MSLRQDAFSRDRLLRFVVKYSGNLPAWETLVNDCFLPRAPTSNQLPSIWMSKRFVCADDNGSRSILLDVSNCLRPFDPFKS